MNRKKQRKKAGVKEIQRCYLCNNKGQIRCKKCKQIICNDCLSENNKHKCYKCDVLELEINKDE